MQLLLRLRLLRLLAAAAALVSPATHRTHLHRKGLYAASLFHGLPCMVDGVGWGGWGWEEGVTSTVTEGCLLLLFLVCPNQGKREGK